MLTNILLSAGILLTAVAPPDLKDATFVGSRFAQCPDQTVVEIKLYDTDKDASTYEYAELYRNYKQVGILDLDKQQIYVTATKELLDVPIAVQRYGESICDLPGGGVGV